MPLQFCMPVPKQHSHSSAWCCASVTLLRLRARALLALLQAVRLARLVKLLTTRDACGALTSAGAGAQSGS